MSNNIKYLDAKNIEHDPKFLLENRDIISTWAYDFSMLLESNNLIKVEFEIGFVVFMDGMWVLQYMAHSDDLSMNRYDVRISEEIYTKYMKPYLEFGEPLTKFYPIIRNKFNFFDNMFSKTKYSLMNFKLQDNTLVRKRSVSYERFTIYSKTFVNQ